jgi:hypothetical protein
MAARRLIVAVPIAEMLAIVGTVVPAVIVFATFDATVTARIIEMQRLTLFSAPTAGFVFCLLGGWWVARRATADPARSGLVLGIAVAAIDLVLLTASGAPFGMLTVTSIVGRIAGGYCGGVLAERGTRAAGALG